jgi:hypothetical protein
LSSIGTSFRSNRQAEARAGWPRGRWPCRFLRTSHRAEDTAQSSRPQGIARRLSQTLSILFIGQAFILAFCRSRSEARSKLTAAVDIPLDAAFCVHAQGETIERYGTSEIFNTDEESQFTCAKHISEFEKDRIKINMDEAANIPLDFHPNEILYFE